MNDTLTTSDVSRQQTQSESSPVHAFSAGVIAGPNNEVMRDIEQRATMLGPVFEEMFLYHWEQFNWEHWGINE